MNIEGLLEQFLKDQQARISDGDTWMTWDKYANEWVVRTQPYRARNSKCLYSGQDLAEALKAFQEATNAS